MYHSIISKIRSYNVMQSRPTENSNDDEDINQLLSQNL